MAPLKVDLSSYDLHGFDRGAGTLKEGLWLFVSLILFRACPLSLSSFKAHVLRLFGARVGRNVVIKPDVRVTFPWKLTLGDHVWIGEGAFLLNLAPLEIESHACISQRAFISTGSHDHSSPGFDLIVKPVVIESGAWIAAGAWVGPGVRVRTHAVLTAQSVANGDLEAFWIYRGNPAVKVRMRTLTG